MGRNDYSIIKNSCDKVMAEKLSVHFSINFGVKSEGQNSAKIKEAKKNLDKLGYGAKLKNWIYDSKIGQKIYDYSGEWNYEYNDALWSFITDYGYKDRYISINFDKDTLYQWIKDEVGKIGTPLDDDIFVEKASKIHNESVRISNARNSLSASVLIINEYYNKVVSSSQYNKIINSQNFLQRLAPELNALKTMPEYIKFNIARNMGLPFSFCGDFLNQNAIGEAWNAIHSLCLLRNQLIINGEFEKAEIVAEKIEYYLQHGTISGFSENLVGLIASTAKDDIKGGARQVVLGNYCDDVTLSGTIGQVLTGIFGVDLPGDIRDVSYDISNWEWSKEHGIQFGIDMVGILPLFGVLKYGDEAKALIKGGNIADAVASAASRRSIRIINAVTEYSTMNRVKQIRGLLPSDLKRGGNLAIATVDIPGLKSEFYAHNLINVLSDARSAQNAVADISVKPTKDIFQACYAVTSDGRTAIRNKDSEFKILSDIASKLGNSVNATGNIKLFTELEPCLSCQDVVIQFLQKYKNITIEVIHNNNKRLIP